MKILIIGNMGYVGSMVVRFLKTIDPEIELFGYDAGFFGHLLTGALCMPETLLKNQFIGDVREFPDKLLEGIDAVVHLAAISNDPMGKEFEIVTDEINCDSSVRIAQQAAVKGVKNFVFASSCSMYGTSDDSPRKEIDPTYPLTAYARSKIATEDKLRNKDLNGMIFTSLRFATACGMSDRLRLDLVLNDFVACAIASRKITVLSDGTPWRPLIDVEDMARAIYWAINRRADNGGMWLAINAGRSENNFRVRDLAQAVACLVPNTEVSINTEAQTDKRSYQVDFSLFKSLAPEYQPQISLDQSITHLVAGLKSIKFDDKHFRDSPYMRLNILRGHVNAGRLTRDLRWLWALK